MDAAVDEEALRALAARWPALPPSLGEDLVTPALVIDADAVEHNVRAVVDWLGGPDRWRPHVKTVKLPWAVERLRAHGVERFKCATTLELAMLLDAGGSDVLFALCARGAGARAVAELARAADGRVSVLVEGPDDVAEWTDTPVSVFVDVDTGLGRTGLPVADLDRIVDVARAVVARGLPFGGLHAYEGWPGTGDADARRRVVGAGLDGLVRAVRALAAAGIETREVVTSGSMTVPWAVGHAALADAVERHSLSPGTVVLHDVRTELTSPWRVGLRPAAAVLTRVVSSARDTRATCDAGHKAVAADVGDPVGLIAGHPELRLLSPSEEHLPLRVQPGARPPRRGDLLTVIPMHVCPTVNLHDVALLVRDGATEHVLGVAGRGHQDPTRTRWARAANGRLVPAPG